MEERHIIKKKTTSRIIEKLLKDEDRSFSREYLFVAIDDFSRERISLSLKATQQDPWQEFATGHRVGELVYGRVTKLVQFGAFVQVGDGIVATGPIGDGGGWEMGGEQTPQTVPGGGLTSPASSVLGCHTGSFLSSRWM